MSRAREFADLAGSADAGGLTGRNLIINGAMQVVQRGTSFTSSGYTLDRFYVNLSGATATTTSENVTVGGESGLPVQFTKYLKFDVSTGDNNAAIWHKVEDVTSVPEGEVTLSFYAKGTNPNGGSVMVYASQIFGSGGSSEVAVTSPHENITLTSSWQRFEITLDVPSLSGKTIGTNSYFWIIIGQPGGDTSTDDWALDITGLQLEVGDKATPFEHRSYGDELARCQRYYYVLGDGSIQSSSKLGNGYGWSSGQVELIVNFPVQLRSAPTLKQGSGSDKYTWASNTGSITFDNLTIYQPNVQNCLLYSAGLSGVAKGDGYRAHLNNDSDGYVAFDAEL